MRSAAVCISAVLCAALVCGSARASDDPYDALLAPSATCGPASDQLNLDPQTAQQVMLCLTNYARQKSGLDSLTANDTLAAAGNAKLNADLTCGVFSHEPCGKPFETVFVAYTQGAASYRIGENIAWGSGSTGTPRAIMNAWLHSEGHRENILTPEFKEVGIGYLSNQAFQGYTGVSLWSQQFGVRTMTAGPAKTKHPAAKKPAKKHVRQKRNRH